MADPVMALGGVRKAAIALAQMDPAHCALVLTQLNESEIEEITEEISRLKGLDPDEAEGVLEDLYYEAVSHKSVGQGGPAFAREILLASLGQERTDQMLARMASRGSASAFAFLQGQENSLIASLVADEHPQTIAVVLTHLDSKKASGVLGLFPTELQTEVAHRIATMRPADPEMLRLVATDLRDRIDAMTTDTTFETLGGVTPLVEMIGFTDRDTEKMILSGIEFRDPGLAEEIRALLFVFEDIVDLDDRAAQMVLRQVEAPDLALALKGAPENVTDKIMRNMSERAADNLKDEIELMGPVKVAAVQEARKKIVAQIRALDESGEIAIQRGNVEESVV
jgi:flagellar motor switch protein FliG